jgi:hypothetical protein
MPDEPMTARMPCPGAFVFDEMNLRGYADVLPAAGLHGIIA